MLWLLTTLDLVTVALLAVHYVDAEDVQVVLPELNAQTDSDVGLDVFQLITKYKYPLERHPNIQTEDGYLLEMHRIPYGVKSGPAANKPVVFLMHGLLSSSADWVNTGPEKSLAFLLADMGYDVWMGNARGNTWSKKHIQYKPDIHKRKFWTFSWNEIGTYDLPAMIDYVLGRTKQRQVYYIGHSQGTTSFFVMCAERPEYNDKVRVMIALAPIVYMKNMTHPLVKYIAFFDGTLEYLASLIGMYEFMPNKKFLSSLGNIACKDGALFQEMCASVIFLIGGFDSVQLNRTLIPVFMTNAPAGASIKQFVHYAQGVNTGEFRKYDYGLVENLLQYASSTPPKYGIKNIRAPVALFYGKNDWLAGIKDVNRLALELPNLVYQYLVPFDKFNHLDFLWATDVVPLLYNTVFKVLKQH